MKKKNVIIIAVIGTVLVFLGGLLIVINQINTQNREKEKREKDLVSYYETFNKYASQFEEKNIEYAEVVSENMYYESVSDEYDKWITEIKSYNELVDNIINSAKPLKKLCINYTYNKEDLRNNCDTYIINYETVMNYFVKDVEEFNKFITDYNAEYEKNVKLYELDSNKYGYLDVNDDGKFIGKD